jgi:biotin synthase
MVDTSNAAERLKRLYEKPNKEDILYYLSTDDETELDEFYRFADDVRRTHVGEAIHLRAIIEFSNYCRRSCLYCGINKHNKGITRYRMPPDEIISTAREAYRKGYRTVVLQSGEDEGYSRDDYIRIIKSIKEINNMAVTLAIGEKNVEEYRAYREAGADRFLLKHETSDPELYEKLNPGMNYKNRINCLIELKKLGFQAGSGIMLGLPGQSLESIANDIMLFLELDIDMIGCGPFISHPDTPLKHSDNDILGEDLSYRVLALNRIVTRDTHLPATTALSTVNEEEGRILALKRGANVIMPNMTPQKYRRFYEIYPNKKRIEVSSLDFRKELSNLAAALGRHISDTQGHRIK